MVIVKFNMTAVAVGFAVGLLNSFMFFLGTFVSAVLTLVVVGLAYISSGCFSKSKRYGAFAFSYFFILVSFLFLARAVLEGESLPSYLAISIFLFPLLFFFLLDYENLIQFIRGYFFSIALSTVFSLIFVYLYHFNMPFYREVSSLFGIGRNTGYSGLYHNPNYWAIYLLSSFPFIFFMRAGFFRTIKHKVFCDAIMLIVLVNIFFTGSRMAFAGALIAIFLYLYFFLFKHKSPSGRNFNSESFLLSIFSFGFLILILVLICFFGGYNLAYWVGFLSDNFVSIERMLLRVDRIIYNIEDDSRFQIALHNYEIFSSSWHNILFGYGVGFGKIPHNTFLSILFEFGVLVFLLFFLWMGRLIKLSYLLVIRSHPLGHFCFSWVVLSILMMLANDYHGTRSFWTVFAILCSLSFIANKLSYSDRLGWLSRRSLNLST
ncbi:O-antigen ligase family protein [Halomonas mongoliensis]|uniref:O-antigen ligase family protein n=1 Tax=Halomonas mongoliensis TaxID=321265 RepID=UPI00403AA16E